MAALGLATTLYVDVFTLNDTPVRPVQLVPTLLCAVAVFLPATRGLRRASPARALALLWCGYSVVRFGLVEPVDGLAATRAVACTAAFLGARELSCRERGGRGLLIGLALGCVVSVFVAAADITLLGRSPRFYGADRWSGLMPGPNRFADLCGLVLVASLACVLRRQAPGRRAAWLLLLATSGVGLLASGSRGGLAAAVVACLATVWLHNRSTGRGLRLVAYLKPLLLVAGVGYVGFAGFSDHLPERVRQFVSFSDEGRDRVRDDPRAVVAAAAWRKFLAAPILGGGAGELDVIGDAHASHNSYLYLLSTSGVVGFVLCGLVIGSVAAPLWRSVHPRAGPAAAGPGAVPALGGLVFLALHMWVIDLVFSMHVWAFLGSAAAAACRPAPRRPSGPAAPTRRRPLTRATPSPRSPRCA